MVRNINYTVLVFGARPRRVGSTHTIFKMGRRFGGRCRGLHPQGTIYKLSFELADCALRMESVTPPKRRIRYSYASQRLGKTSVFLPLVVVSNFKALQRADHKQLSSRRSFKSLHCYFRINLYSRGFHHSIHNSIHDLPLTNSMSFDLMEWTLSTL